MHPTYLNMLKRPTSLGTSMGGLTGAAGVPSAVFSLSVSPFVFAASSTFFLRANGFRLRLAEGCPVGVADSGLDEVAASGTVTEGAAESRSRAAFSASRVVAVSGRDADIVFEWSIGWSKKD